MKQPSEQDLIHRSALNYLSRRDHSELELTQKLENKGYTTTSIEQAINALKQAGLLNDARFAEHYCHRRRERGYGPLRISAELQARGIDAETIAEVIRIADNEWFIAVANLSRKRFKGQLSDDLTRRAKQMRFLQYRGFTREQINNAFKK